MKPVAKEIGICKNCKKEFECRPFCSQKCYHEYRKNKSFDDLFGESKSKEIRERMSNSNKGKHIEHFIEIGKKNKGKHPSPQTEFKNGSLHPNWKGGITEELYFYSSPEWKKLRVEFRKDKVCDMCGKAENKHVHHKLSVRIHPELKYDTNNLRVLCNSCHAKVESLGDSR